VVFELALDRFDTALEIVRGARGRVFDLASVVDPARSGLPAAVAATHAARDSGSSFPGTGTEADESSRIHQLAHDARFATH
jgi:hypothetical protein